LGAVSDEATVDDIEAEWLDRYGPVPHEAAVLLDIARLRAQCVRCGIGEVGMLRSGAVRLAPVDLKVSEQMRLSRIAPSSRWKEEVDELQITVPKNADLPAFLRDFLLSLRPPEE
jgi:transcription-repair coupling factor (superfamily II helicase)